MVAMKPYEGLSETGGESNFQKASKPSHEQKAVLTNGFIKKSQKTPKAEKELGGGTGQIKLRYVYDMFVARFAWLARVISFEAFSMMVDEALERMKKMLESNKAMQTLVSGEAGEVNE